MFRREFSLANESEQVTRCRRRKTRCVECESWLRWRFASLYNGVDTKKVQYNKAVASELEDLQDDEKWQELDIFIFRFQPCKPSGDSKSSRHI